MKRNLSFILAVVLLFSLCGCNGSPTQTETGSLPLSETDDAKDTETKKEETETVEKTEDETATLPSWLSPEERVYETVEEILTPERLAEIPIANSSMSIAQLRQICVDYVCLSVSFQWIPNSDFSYKVVNQGASASFIEGQLYGGIPYVNVASGNLYRILEYYDTETGVLNVTPFRSNNLLMGTACSGTACWGWQRVINSAKCGFTADMTVKNGFIRVGDYTYDDSTVRYGEGGKEDCSDIAKRNGSDVMYASYAKLQVADCLVNNGHVRMVKEAPHIEYDENGKIDPKKSYVVQCEQGLYTTSETHDRFTSNGTKYKIQGNDNYIATFEKLFTDGYLPHTFAEFLGTDPVEKATATIKYSEPTASVNDLQKCTVKANYSISDIFTVITDPEGKELFRYVYRSGNHFINSVDCVLCLPGSALLSHQEAGTNKISITCQLSTGDLVTVYEGTLVTNA